MIPQDNTFPRWMNALVALTLLALLVGDTLFCKKASGQEPGGQGPFSVQTPASTSAVPSLTDEERAWLKEHPVIRVVQDPGWPPVEFSDDRGEASGISNDYLDLIELRLGIKFERVRNLSWQEAYARLKRWDIDMTTSVAVTHERTEFWEFTKPYMTIPIVILTNSDVTYIGAMRELEGKKIGVVDGYVSNEWIKRDFPDIQLVKVKTVKEGLDLLQKGEVFAFVDNMLVIGYYMAKLKLVNFKIAGGTPYANAQCMAVRKDWAILAGIIQKALDSISETEREQIYQKWVPIRYEQVFDYKVLWQALAIVAVILGGLIVWNRKLSREIRYREEAEAALGESERRYRDLWEKAPIMMISLDPDGRMVSVSDRFLDMLGYAREEVLGRTPFVFQTAESRLHATSFAFPTFMKTGLLKDVPLQFVKKNGDVIDVLLSATAERDDQGNIIRSRSVFIDVTEKKRAEKELRESEEKFSKAFANNPAMLAIVHMETYKVVEVNDAWTRVFGYTREEAIGRTTVELGIYDEKTHPKIMEEARAKDSVRDVEVTGKTRTGENRVLLVSREVIAIRDEPHLLAMGWDITDRKKAEEALRESEERHRSLIEHLPQRIFIKDRNSVYVSCNTNYAADLGIVPEQIVGKDDFAFHPVELAQMYRADDQACMATGTVKDFEEPYQLAGQERWAHTIKVPYRDGQGRVIGVLGIFEDITERIMKEEALLESEERFRLTFQTSPDAININRLSDGVYVDVNDGFTETTGYSREEVIGKSSLELNIWPNPQDRQRLVESLQEAGYVPNLEAKFRFKDGTVITGLMSARVIMLKGEPHIVSITRNIEEWRRTQEALRESEQRYRTLFEESMDGVYSVLRDGTIRDANASFCKLFGYTREEMIGNDILELYIDPADRPKFQEEIEKKGSVKDYEVKWRKRDGTEVDCLLTSSVYFGQDGSITGYRGILRDLTVRKGLQRQLLQAQKMEAVGTLAGGIAHDFNNILQVVCGFSEIILMGKGKGDPEYEDLEKVLSAGKKGADLVQRLLTFSRKTEINPKPLNLNHQIQRVEAILQRTIPKIIKIDMILADGLSAINADPTQVEQILMNLAINARDAMSEGGRLILETSNVTLDEAYCNTHLGSKPGDYVLLTVSDTGEGMDKDTLQHIFEPFFSTKAAGRGTGLGLAMVYGIVKQHDGYITCYSEFGVGTAFKLYFPVTEMKVEPNVQHEERRLPGGSETILLVDDEDLVRELAKRILGRAGYTVLTASNGREAVQIYKKKGQNISLIVLDLIMPEMDGKQCLRELLNINLGARVLMASGYSANGPTKEALEGGAKGFVSKPFDMGQLLQTVRKVLDEA